MVPLIVFQITNSLSWSGFAFFFESLPRFLSFPYCGLLCDRKRSYDLLRISQLARMAVCLLGGVACFYAPHIFWLVVISALAGVLTTQGLMAREVIIVQSFKHYRYEKILSYTQISDQAGTVLGPILAASFLSLISWQALVLIIGITFLLSDVVIYMWRFFSQPHFPLPKYEKTNAIEDFRAAASNVIKLEGLKETIALALSVNFMLGVTLVTSAAIVTGIQGHDEIYYGLVQTAAALATVVVLLFTAHGTMKISNFGILGYVAICLGGFMVSVTDASLVYVLGFLLVIGFDKMFSIYIRSLRKRIIPSNDFGKTTGLVVLLNNISQPLAGLLVGVLALSYGPSSIIFFASLLMASIGLYIFLFRKLHRVEVRT